MDNNTELATRILDWLMHNGYDDEMDRLEHVYIFDWLDTADTSGKSIRELALEYELDRF